MIFIHVANFSVAELHKLTDKLSFSDCTVFLKHQKTTLFPMSGGNVVLKKKKNRCDGDDCFALVSWLRGRVRGVNLTASAFLRILTHTHHAAQLLSC